MVIFIATKVNDGSIHLFKVIAGFSGGHEVLSQAQFEGWKGTVVWDWKKDEQGRPITPFGPDFKGNPGHPNVLSYSESTKEDCQLCRIVNKTGRLPVPKVMLTDKLPKKVDDSKDPNRPGVLYLVRKHEEKND